MTPYEELQPYLRPQEQLLWAGRPDPQVLFSPSDAFMIPFSLMWGGFAVFWEAGVVGSGAPVFFRLWGIPFVLVGLYMIFGRFVYKRRQKAATVYAVTDQRAIALVNGRTLTDTPVKYQPVTVKRSRDGQHATVLIGNGMAAGRGAAMYANTGMDFFNRSGTGFFGFFDVASPNDMLQAVEKARS